MWAGVAPVLFVGLLARVAYAAAAAAAASGGSHRALRYNVSEELPAGTLIGDIGADFAALTSTAVDPGARYSLRRPSGHFRLDGAVMRTAAVIDREAVCPSRPRRCELAADVVLRARRKVSVVKVVVGVADVNDHAPTFRGLATAVELAIPVHAGVGALFPLPAADDADAGALGVVGYRLDGVFPRDLFALRVNELVDGSHDVRLRLAAPLRRRPTAAAAAYSMRLVAVDGGDRPRSGSVEVTVTVERPAAPAVVFQPSLYTARIAENAARRHPIVHVRARPPPAAADSAHLPPADVVYRLADGQSSAFDIDARTGLVYVNDTIDYERDREFRLMVGISEMIDLSFNLLLSISK